MHRKDIMNIVSRTILTATAAAVTIAALTGCTIGQDILDEVLDSDTTTTGDEHPAADIDTDFDEDYYTVIGTAERDYDPEKPGAVEYCDLDDLDRAVCAYGELTYSLRNDAQRRGRQDINVDSPGMEYNDKVHIDPLPTEDSNDDNGYNGYFYNRSHLVGDSIGGDPQLENLVTGTRTQNVGSVNNSGGMAYTEIIARDYLDSKIADDCPLYYSATPQYSGEELLPRTVTVDIQSCDKTIDERVEVSNTAYGYDIDYATGQWTATD